MKAFFNPEKPIKPLFDSLLKLLLLVILLCVFVPLSPKMPAPGLDPSWAMGLNQAVAQGLAFGKDIIFTLGPYSSIYTKAYHPATDFMMIAGSCYLALSYWLAMILLMTPLRWPWIVGAFIFFSGMIYARDSLLFSYPLLVGLIAYKSLFFTEGLERKYIGLLFAPFGLLALVKGSFLILCLFTTLLSSAFYLSYRKPLLAGLCLISFLGSMQLFWLAAGQTLVDLPSYLWQTFSLAASFSEAMALDGNPAEILVYILCTGFLFAILFWQKQSPLAAKLFLFSLFFVFLFISFKAGFARHFGHSFIPGTSILLAALAFSFVHDSKRSLAIIFAALCTWSFIIEQHSRFSLRNNAISTYAPAWHGLKNRFSDKNWLEQNFAATTGFLHSQTSFPQLTGTTDIYSFEQAFLLSSPNKWSPRPIFQSYSVFNSQLAEKNRNHLLSPNSPDNIIFRIEPIDNRVPALEDGSSWPLLVANYRPNEAVQDFLLLKKREAPPLASKIMTPLRTEKHQLGESVTLPSLNEAVFVEIEMRATLWGKLATILLKPKQLEIRFSLKDGSQRTYRLIASMAKSGFLLSPLVENTAEFALLYDQETELDSKMVKSFSIDINQESWPQWHSSYIVHFNRVEAAFPSPSSRAQRRIS
ncbi:hypothetical protein BN59_00564 [Legionella massiliensis]|uniref:Transmembrane protein n=1 Tax=Legionella massiliensis TaxID=1034943 RepID=A0A078KTK8_9GAMM|nr:hypothetical protein [Legionella massiliensis]CDZ76297.1 hypothetical protein BN59_00564 [Legionella massiliensis]CEE12035.1 hypothetical protein BN1094_00564 [Legionella massiliensis]